jgi:hypothetical protein
MEALMSYSSIRSRLAGKALIGFNMDAADPVGPSAKSGGEVRGPTAKFGSEVRIQSSNAMVGSEIRLAD